MSSGKEKFSVVFWKTGVSWQKWQRADDCSTHARLRLRMPVCRWCVVWFAARWAFDGHEIACYGMLLERCGRPSMTCRPKVCEDPPASVWKLIGISGSVCFTAGWTMKWEVVLHPYFRVMRVQYWIVEKWAVEPGSISVKAPAQPSTTTVPPSMAPYRETP